MQHTRGRSRIVIRGSLFILATLLTFGTLISAGLFHAPGVHAQSEDDPPIAPDGQKFQCQVSISGDLFWQDAPSPDLASSCGSLPNWTGETRLVDFTDDEREVEPIPDEPEDDPEGGPEGPTEPIPPEEPTCESNLPGLGWILCVVAEYLIVFLEDAIGGTLIPSILNYNLIADEANQAGLLSVWSGFRILANIGFVIAFMVVIYAAASGNALSAYDVKRLLPRLLIGSIMVQLSFFICRELVELFNALGSGVTDLMLAPLPGGDERSGLVPSEYSQANGGGGLAVWGEEFATVLTVILLIVAMLFAIGGILTVIIVFILRNIILTILIVISPIAFVAWVLPNTENLFKRWFKFFINNLALFPVAMAFFASGRLMKEIWVDSTAADPQFGNVIIGVIMVFLPWVFASQLGKLTNRLTGGAVAAVQGGMQRARESGSKAGSMVGSERHATKAKAGEYGGAVAAVTNPGAYVGWGRGRRKARSRQAAEALESEDAKAATINLQTQRAETRKRAHREKYVEEMRTAGRQANASGIPFDVGDPARVAAEEAATEAATNHAGKKEVEMLTKIVNSKGSKAEDVRAASKVLMDVHGNDAGAVEAVNKRVLNLRSTGGAKDARLADRIVNDNIGSAGGIPQLFKPNNVDTIEGLNVDSLHNLKGGSLKYFLKEDANTYKLAERYSADIASTSSRGKVKAGSAKTIHDTLKGINQPEADRFRHTMGSNGIDVSGW